MDNTLFLTRHPNNQVYFAYFTMTQEHRLTFITSIQNLTVKDNAQVYKTAYCVVKSLQVLSYDTDHWSERIHEMVDMVYLRNFDLEKNQMEFIGLFGRRELPATSMRYYLVYSSWEGSELDFKLSHMYWTYMIKQDRKSLMQMPSWCTGRRYQSDPPRYIRQYNLKHSTIAVLIGYDKCVMQYLIRRGQWIQPNGKAPAKSMMAKKVFEYDVEFFRAI